MLTISQNGSVVELKCDTCKDDSVTLEADTDQIDTLFQAAYKIGWYRGYNKSETKVKDTCGVCMKGLLQHAAKLERIEQELAKKSSKEDSK